MSTDAEQQAEEIEVLKSIYEGDDNFKQVDATTYQYKYIDEEKSFILEITWGPSYPTEIPSFNLEIFYNQSFYHHAPLYTSVQDDPPCPENGLKECHLKKFLRLLETLMTSVAAGLPSVKEKILSIVNTEAEQWVGCAMTYTLFECLKEKVTEILSEQTEEAVVARVEKMALTEQSESKKPEKKEQLSKAQKRRAWDRAEIGRAGEKPRGWDWVDIVKHLSQAPHTPS